MVIEGQLVFHPIPFTKYGLATLITSLSAYATLVFYLGIRYSVWAYPFLELLSMPLRLVIAVIGVLIAIPIYKLGEAIHRVTWRKKLAALQSSDEQLETSLRQI